MRHYVPLSGQSASNKNERNESMADDKDICSRMHPSIKNMIIVGLRDDVAKSLGFDTGKKKKSFLDAQKRYAKEQHQKYIESKLSVVRGKSTENIPDKYCCYEIYFTPEDEARLEGEKIVLIYYLNISIFISCMINIGN